MPHTFTPQELSDLPAVISAPRFATYLSARGGNTADALALYRWNLQVSAAFFVPLQVCEVALRNGIAEAIGAVHTNAWHWNAGFLRSLPRTGRYVPYDELMQVRARHTRVGQVVANLSFIFWQKMLTVGHQQRIWDAHLYNVFPGLPPGRPVGATLRAMHDEVEKVRKLRNRIAHHEPIFSRALGAEYTRIRTLIEYRNPGAAGWVDRIQTVTGLLAAPP